MTTTSTLSFFPTSSYVLLPFLFYYPIIHTYIQCLSIYLSSSLPVQINDSILGVLYNLNLSHGFDPSKPLKKKKKKTLFSVSFSLFLSIMGACLSATKVSGSNSNNTHNHTTTTTVNHNRRERTKSQTTTTTASTTTTATTKKHEASSHQRQTKANERNSHQLRPKEKPVSRRQSGVIPCGKRTDFGYAKDFDNCYTIGKLLGHGQFGYTYVATDKSNGDRVAVKRIEKNKVVCLFL